MSKDSGIVIVLTTAGTEAEARAIARDTVEKRLAACVQCSPVQSVYRWKGVVEEAGEVLLVLKTSADRSDELVARIRALHSYELPEILVVPAAGGMPEYLSWIRHETSALSVDSPPPVSLA